MKKNNLKKISYKKRGDKVQVKLFDKEWNMFFDSGEVSIRDNKSMKQLAKKLNDYGVDFSKYHDDGWFD